MSSWKLALAAAVLGAGLLTVSGPASAPATAGGLALPSTAPSPAPVSAAEDPPLIDAPEAVSQGGTLLITVRYRRTSAPPDAVSLLFRSEAVPVVMEAGRAWAMVGIEPWAEARAEPLLATVVYQDGSRDAASTNVTIRPVNWPTLRLSIADDISRALTPEVVNGEVERLDAIYRSLYPLKLWSGSFEQPTAGVQTSPFGERRSYGDSPADSWHLGLDVAAPSGQPVRAMNDGVVVFTGALAVRGNTVILDHGMGLMSSYFHLSSIGAEVGQRLKKGESVGRVGTTGRSTGPHLHWEVRVRGVATAPSEWLRRTVGEPPPPASPAAPATPPR